METVFNVGANKGDWTNLVLQTNLSAEIHCFEPVNQTFELLHANNFPSSVKLNQMAFSSMAGNVAMCTDGVSGCNSMFDRQWSFEKTGESHDIMTVTCTTLDIYCQQNNVDKIDMLKMDVEGSEYSILMGAKKMLTDKKISCIQFEYDRSYIDVRVWLRDMFDLLKPLGFTLKKVYPDTLKTISEV